MIECGTGVLCIAGVPSIVGGLGIAAAGYGTAQNGASLLGKAFSEASSESSSSGASSESSSHAVGKGDDPLVPELIDDINARYPGHVRGQGIEVYGKDGKALTDFDIVTRNAVVQVKSGSGKGALKQALVTQKLTSYPVIVYLPQGRGSVIKSLERAGFMVTRDKGELLDALAP
ncbi:hypothetical protein [Streptomyces sp. NPDC059631]|uniref:hypothetical protein n=1 Tax=unclassified Streptomyces TaxID=2593676 RepID=UPI0036A9B0F6